MSLYEHGGAAHVVGALDRAQAAFPDDLPLHVQGDQSRACRRRRRPAARRWRESARQSRSSDRTCWGRPAAVGSARGSCRVSASRQRTRRFAPSSSDAVRKTRLPQTTGEEFPSPGSAVRHSTFSVLAPHERADVDRRRFPAVATPGRPVPRGRRNLGARGRQTNGKHRREKTEKRGRKLLLSLRIGLVLPKGTVPFSSNENWTVPHLFFRRSLEGKEGENGSRLVCLSLFAFEKSSDPFSQVAGTGLKILAGDVSGLFRKSPPAGSPDRSGSPDSSGNRPRRDGTRRSGPPPPARRSTGSCPTAAARGSSAGDAAKSRPASTRRSRGGHGWPPIAAPTRGRRAAAFSISAMSSPGRPSSR